MDPKRNKLPTIAVIVLALLVLIALGVLIWVIAGHVGAPAPVLAPAPAPVTAEPVTPEPAAAGTPVPETPIPETTDAPADTAPSVELAETEDMGQEYIDKIVFLGDSTTYGMGAYGVLPFTQIWTAEAGTLALFNWEIDPIAYYDPADPYNAKKLSIPECAAARKPEYLVITLGVNGIAFLDEAEFKDYYTEMVQAIQAASPDTKIICQSIYPVLDDVTPGGIDNAGVNAANKWIYDVAEATGTRYLNTHDLLMDDTGNMRRSYSNGDSMGIHLNTTGFDVVLNNIRTHGWQ